jgi:hypothetical protein
MRLAADDGDARLKLGADFGEQAPLKGVRGGFQRFNLLEAGSVVRICLPAGAGY